MMRLLLTTIVFSQAVMGVLTRYNVSFVDDDNRERHTHASGLPYYDYYENQDTGMDSGNSYYTPVMQYPATQYRPVHFYHQQHEGIKYPQDNTGDLCTWGKSFMSQIMKIGVAKIGLVSVIKAVIALIGTGFIAKIKFILFKLIVLPIALLLLKLPILLPTLLPFLILFLLKSGSAYGECKNSKDCNDTRIQDKNKNIEERISRALKAFIKSEACIGRLACELGGLNSQSEYNRHIKWLIGYMQKTAAEDDRTILTTYKTAYLRGNEGMNCNEDFYGCDLRQVFTAAACYLLGFQFASIENGETLYYQTQPNVNLLGWWTNGELITVSSRAHSLHVSLRCRASATGFSDEATMFMTLVAELLLT